VSQQKNRLRVADELLDHDLTQAQLVERTGLGAATVSRWLQVLVSEGHVHVCRYKAIPHGGRDAAVYRRGPQPKGVKPKTRRVLTDQERSRTYRRKQRASGEWEHKKALERARWRADHPVRDALTVALFGSAP